MTTQPPSVPDTATTTTTENLAPSFLASFARDHRECVRRMGRILDKAHLESDKEFLEKCCMRMSEMRSSESDEQTVGSIQDRRVRMEATKTRFLDDLTSMLFVERETAFWIKRAEEENWRRNLRDVYIRPKV